MERVCKYSCRPLWLSQVKINWKSLEQINEQLSFHRVKMNIFIMVYYGLMGNLDFFAHSQDKFRDCLAMKLLKTKRNANECEMLYGQRRIYRRDHGKML